MSLHEFLRAEDIPRLGEAVLAVLEEVGVLCQSEELLASLAELGAVTDAARETARFPRELCEPLLDEVREQATSEGETAPTFHGHLPPIMSVQIAQLYYDWRLRERRPGNAHDLTEAVRLGEVLHGDSGVGHCLLLTEVPPLIEPLEAAYVLAENATHPHPAFAWEVRQAEYLREMGHVLGYDEWFTFGAICFAHPLRFDRDVAGRFVARARTGAPTGLTAMPVGGVTTPIPVAGFITVAAAEILATWIAARSLHPAAPFTGSIWGGAMDMRTGEVSYSSFDAMRYAIASSEFLHKWTGHRIHVGGGEYCSAREPGYYAAYEKAHKAMTIAAFTGHHPPIGQGMIESGKTLCPVQWLLEREVAEGLALYAEMAEVSDATIALSDITDVGFGLERTYLGTDLTLRGYRDHAWVPRVMERDGWRGASTDERVLDAMQRRMDELLETYSPPEIDSADLRALRAIIHRASHIPSPPGRGPGRG